LDGTTALVKFKGSLIYGTSISPRIGSGTPTKAYKKRKNTGTPRKSYPNKVSEHLFGTLGLPLLSSITSGSLNTDEQAPLPFGGNPGESENSSMELDHLPTCRQNKPTTYICPPQHNDETNHCPNCSCFKNNGSPAIESPIEPDKSRSQEGFPKKFIASGHLHGQECIAPVPNEPPNSGAKGGGAVGETPDSLLSPSPQPVPEKPEKKSAVRWGGDDGGFSISTMYGSVPVDPGPGKLQ
jgi:hypothetical protein